MARRFSRIRLLLYTLVLLAIFFLARSLWLPFAGSLLVHDDGPAKADIVVVLAGDYHGLRILKGAELVRQGYAPKVLVSGPPDFFGRPESDAAIPFAVSHGYPADWFVACPHEGLSTRTEADAVLKELRRLNVTNFLLVTSDYHSARARRIYLAQEKAAGGGPSFRTVPAPDKYFKAKTWWHSREAQKTVFMEWCKSLATVFGM